MRPLRSLLVGDVDHYPSEFAFIVNQGMTMLGHWHTTVNVRAPIDVIAKRFAQVQPDIAWMHMLLWSPGGIMQTTNLLALCEDYKRAGTKIIMHDGDARLETRMPIDISHAVDLVLANHTVDRSAWKIAQLRWPYAAFRQRRIAGPDERWRCRLLFAGRVGLGLYQDRSDLLWKVQDRLGKDFRIVIPGTTGAHSLFETPTVAASADAVLGYGRPSLPGWTDVRVFQYPGAGGVLLHDDAAEWLEPYIHYIPYLSNDPASIVDAVDRATIDGPAIRPRAFRYVQAKHSSVVRVRTALAAVGLSKGGHDGHED